MIPHPHEWEPEYSWEDIPNGCNYPSLSWTVGPGRTLAKGSFYPMKFGIGSSSVSIPTHAWSETSSHLIMFNRLEHGQPYVAIPARIVGALLTWLRDQATPPYLLWWGIEFWLHRTEQDEWVWFKDDSSDAMVYLPWKQNLGKDIVNNIMTI
jgi:hypothetical protein